MPSMKKNILLIAHEFSPNIGSECEQGWLLARAISKISNDNVFICHASGNQFVTNIYTDNIEKYGLNTSCPLICVNYSPFMKFLGYLNSFFISKFGPIGFPPLFFYIYSLWQKKAFKQISNLNIDFDVVHVLNLINATSPGPWWRLKSKTIIWGPTGGLVDGTPNTFKEHLRALFISFSKMSNNYKMFVSKSKVIFTFDKSNINLDKQIFLPESGINILSPYKYIDEVNVYNCYFAGHYNLRKGFNKFNLVAKNFQFDNKFNFHSFGRGSLIPFLNVIDHGFLNRNDFMNYLSDMDILILPSYREGTPHVIMEAISNNILVVSTDVGGIASFICDDCCLNYNDFDDEIIPLMLRLKDIHYYNYCLEIQYKKSINYTWENIALNIVNKY